MASMTQEKPRDGKLPCEVLALMGSVQEVPIEIQLMVPRFPPPPPPFPFAGAGTFTLEREGPGRVLEICPSPALTY